MSDQFATPEKTAETDASPVFQAAAELFALLSTPIRLQIISSVCHVEKTVSQLLSEIDTTQPNLSQHLAVLHRSGVLSRRKEGTSVFYKVQDQRAATVCRSVCNQIALEMA
jgi:ArsR family transcriptional regulator